MRLEPSSSPEAILYESVEDHPVRPRLSVPLTSRQRNKCWSEGSRHSDASALQRQGVWIGDLKNPARCVSSLSFNELVQRYEIGPTGATKSSEGPRILHSKSLKAQSKLTECVACQRTDASERRLCVRLQSFVVSYKDRSARHVSKVRWVWMYPCKLDDREVFAIVSSFPGGKNGCKWQFHLENGGHLELYPLETVLEEHQRTDSSPLVTLPSSSPSPSVNTFYTITQQFQREQAVNYRRPYCETEPESSNIRKRKRSTSTMDISERGQDAPMTENARTRNDGDMDDEIQVRSSMDGARSHSQLSPAPTRAGTATTASSQPAGTLHMTRIIRIRISHKDILNTIHGRLDGGMSAEDVFKSIKSYLEDENEARPMSVKRLRVVSPDLPGEVFVLRLDEDADSDWEWILERLEGAHARNQLDIRAITE